MRLITFEHFIPRKEVKDYLNAPNKDLYSGMITGLNQELYYRFHDNLSLRNQFKDDLDFFNAIFEAENQFLKLQNNPIEFQEQFLKHRKGDLRDFYILRSLIEILELNQRFFNPFKGVSGSDSDGTFKKNADLIRTYELALGRIRSYVENLAEVLFTESPETLDHYIENPKSGNNDISPFKPIEGSGSISRRVMAVLLVVLYNKRAFVLASDGSLPTQEKFVTTVGAFFGYDMADYMNEVGNVKRSVKDTFEQLLNSFLSIWKVIKNE